MEQVQIRMLRANRRHLRALAGLGNQPMHKCIAHHAMRADGRVWCLAVPLMQDGDQALLQRVNENPGHCCRGHPRRNAGLRLF